MKRYLTICDSFDIAMRRHLGFSKPMVPMAAYRVAMFGAAAADKPLLALNMLGISVVGGLFAEEKLPRVMARHAIRRKTGTRILQSVQFTLAASAVCCGLYSEAKLPPLLTPYIRLMTQWAAVPNAVPILPTRGEKNKPRLIP